MVTPTSNEIRLTPNAREQSDRADDTGSKLGGQLLQKALVLTQRPLSRCLDGAHILTAGPISRTQRPGFRAVVEESEDGQSLHFLGLSWMAEQCSVER